MVIANGSPPLVDNEEEQVDGGALDCEKVDEVVELAGDPTAEKRQKQDEEE